MTRLKSGFTLAAASLAFVVSVVTSFTPAYAVAKRWYSETQATTRAVPSGTPGAAPTSASVNGTQYQGMNLQDVAGYRVSVCTVQQDAGTYLGGSGYLRAYLYNDSIQRWMHDKDLDLTVTLTGTDCQQWADSSVAAPISDHRVLYVAESVSVLYADGGVATDGGVTVRIDGRLKKE